MSTKKPIKHFLQFSDFTLAEFEYVIERAKIIKRKFKSYEIYHPLIDRTLVMVFEKNSTRTRLSFEAGMHQLGGAAIYLNTRDSQLGRGEPVEDAGQVMSRMCDIIMVRTFGQEIIERFAANSRVPVINGLTNEHHPCQVLADISPITSTAARSPARPWPGSATPTTCCTRGCRRPKCSAST
jgi:ornithine carbamoyltransferase